MNVHIISRRLYTCPAKSVHQRPVNESKLFLWPYMECIHNTDKEVTILNMERKENSLTTEFFVDPMCLSQPFFSSSSSKTSFLSGNSQVIFQTLSQCFSFFNLRSQLGDLALIASQLKTYIFLISWTYTKICLQDHWDHLPKHLNF